MRNTSEHIQNSSFTDKLHLVVSNPNAVTFAYDRLSVCRAAAEIQMHRIWEASRASRAEIPELASNASQAEMKIYFANTKKSKIPLIYETHFYFVAWANCGNMLRVLTGQPEFLEAKKIFDSYRKDFEHYTAGRNSFEHYHDRLPGNPENKRVREVTEGTGNNPHRIYLGFSGGNYKHSDSVWDITPASLELLGKAIDETLVALHQQVDTLFQAKFAS